MKKRFLCCLVFIIFIGWGNFSSGSTAVEVGLSVPIIIIGTEPVQMKFPDSEDYINVFSTAPFPPGTTIAPENTAPFQVLCPDWSIKVAPDGDTSECPEVEVLAKVTPPIIPSPPPPTRVPDEEEKYHEAIAQLEVQPVTEKDPVLKRLLCYLYQNAGEYDKAVSCYRQAAELSRQKGDVAGQAFAQYQLAFILWAREKEDEAIEQAWKAFEVYQQPEKSEERLRKIERYYQEALELAQEEEDQEKQLLAQYQLALIAHALGEKAKCKQQAEEVLKLSEKIEYPIMGKRQMKELIVKQIQKLLRQVQNAQ